MRAFLWLRNALLAVWAFGCLLIVIGGSRKGGFDLVSRRS